MYHEYAVIYDYLYHVLVNEHFRKTFSISKYVFHGLLKYNLTFRNVKVNNFNYRKF